MRAILLVKDKEGLTSDRLHGRYGLTGKATVTQSTIAGSLSSSFKAGQNVSLQNLRALTAKIKEAQNAMNGASENIDKIAETVDKTKEKQDEVTQLLSTNLWSKLWSGELTPAQFYGAKYSEDISNERMAGEPGYPVYNCGTSIDVAPIPRTLYWDPWLAISSIPIANLDWTRFFKGGATDLTTDSFEPYLDEGVLTWIKTSHTLQETLTTMQNLRNVMDLISKAMGALIYILMGIRSGNMVLAVIKSIGSFILDYLAVEVPNLILEYMLEVLQQAGIRGSILQASRDSHSAISSTFPKALGQYKTDWFFTSFTPPIFETLFGIILSYKTIIVTMNAAATALILTGAVLEKFPYTAAIGRAMQFAGEQLSAVAFFLYTENVIFNVAKIALTFNKALYTTMTKRKATLSEIFPMDLCFPDFEDVPHYEDSYNHGNYVYTEVGNLTEFKEFPLAIDIILKFTDFFNFALDALIQQIVDIENVTRGYYATWGSSDCYIRSISQKHSDSFMYDDCFNNANFRLNWSYNLTNYGSTNAGMLNNQVSYKGRTLELKAHVYKGNYYKIKAFDNHSITKTVVIREHFEAGDWEYYSLLNLVALDGNDNKLYLHSERNAIYYTGSYRLNSGQLLHAEQSIYNFDYKSGHSGIFTNDRRGRLHYYYMDFADGVKLQYRPNTSGKDLYLDGELINTVYKWDNYATLNTMPRHGTTEGDIYSYCSG